MMYRIIIIIIIIAIRMTLMKRTTTLEYKTYNEKAEVLQHAQNKTLQVRNRKNSIMHVRMLMVMASDEGAARRSSAFI
jgi:replicative DNA helicase